MEKLARTLTLKTSQTYHYGGESFERDIPKPVEIDWLFSRLLLTGMFEENPPLCFYHIRYNGNRPSFAQDVGDDFLFIPKDGVTKVSRYQYSLLKDQKGIEVVPPLEIMDEMVSKGKPNFKLLVIRDNNLGDVILTTDIMFHLRERYPQAHITFATYPEYACVYDNLGIVDNIISMLEIDGRDYDVSVDLCNWVEQYPLCKEMERLDLFGFAFSKDFPWKQHKVHLKTSQAENLWLDKFLKNNKICDKPIAFVQPYGSGPHRSLSKEAVDGVALWLKSQGFFVAIVGVENKRFPYLQNEFHEEDDIKVFWNQLSIREVITLVSVAALVVGPDSSIYHIASAWNTPSVTVFTTIHEGTRVSHYPFTKPLRAEELGCCPCWDRPCGFKRETPCVDAMTADRIIVACSEMIENGFKEVKHPLYAPSSRKIQQTR
jgi:ADP-heptose:LPS heptosyltransferase